MARTEGNVQLQSKDFESVKFAHSSAVVAGEVIVIDAASGMVGIAAEAGAANESITYYTKGVFRFPIYTGVTVAQFDVCYWDVSENKVIIASPVSGDPVLGYAVAAGTATAGYVDVAINEIKNKVSLEHLDSGIAPSYICVGYGQVASNAGTGGTFAISGALTTDKVVPIVVGTAWTKTTSGGPAINKLYVSTAGVVTYEIGGTGFAGTAGGIGGMLMRAAS